MKTEIVVGKEVVGSGGASIGKVKGLVFDETSWKIETFEVELTGEMAKEYGMKKLLTKSIINVPVASVKAIGDHVMLSIDKGELEKLATQHKD